MTGSRTQRLIVILGLAISAVFLALAFYGLQPENILGSIQTANVPLLLFAAVWYFAAVSLISLRWKFLLRAIQDVPLGKMISFVCVGYMGNNVYPFRTGEILRVWLANRIGRVPFTRALATTIVERIFDGLVMLTFIFVGLTVVDISSLEARTALNFATPLFIAALLVFFALAARPNILRRLVSAFSGFLPKRLRDVSEHLTEEFIGGLAGLRSPVDLAGAVITSYLSWMVEASVYWLVAMAFQLEVSYPLMLLTVGVVNLSGLVPASPGQWGVFEFVAKSVLIAGGVPESSAIAFAITIHVTIWLPVTLMGFFFLSRYGLNWKTVTHARELGQDESQEFVVNS